VFSATWHLVQDAERPKNRPRTNTLEVQDFFRTYIAACLGQRRSPTKGVWYNMFASQLDAACAAVDAAIDGFVFSLVKKVAIHGPKEG
jgi:hypothetical protein